MISKATTENLSKLVEIHRVVLNKTFTSRVGKSFILALYNVLLSHSSNSEVFISKSGNKVRGFLSLTKDRSELNKIINRQISLGRKARLAAFVLLHPGLVSRLYSKIMLDHFISNRKGEYPSVLTLGVSTEFRGTGVGSQLILRANKYFKDLGVPKYFVDTDSSNESALQFYIKMGFKRVAAVAGNVVLEKKI